ncbi:MAG: hypothetical protein Q8L57_00605, partial [bacterium]|nr:hypothetical protein [bacterium]
MALSRNKAKNGWLFGCYLVRWTVGALRVALPIAAALPRPRTLVQVVAPTELSAVFQRISESQASLNPAEAPRVLSKVIKTLNTA